MKPAGLAGPWFPSGAGVAVTAAGVETKSGNDEEDVAVFRVERDPPAFAGAAVSAKPLRRHRSPKQAGAIQDVGDGTGAIVAGVAKPAMASATSVWLARKFVAGC